MLCRMVTDVLWLDTMVFLVIALVLAIIHRMRRQDQYRFPRTMRFLILALFPWLVLLLWLEKPTRKMRHRNRRIYNACYLFFTYTTLLLIGMGIFIQNSALADWGAIVYVWMVFLNLLVVKGENNGGNDANHDDSPPPDDPTPTGDAVDRWLRSQRPLTEASLHPVLFHRSDYLSMISSCLAPVWITL